MNYFVTKFAAEFNCGAYGASTYNNGQVCAAQTTAANGGSLANTGLDVMAPLSAGILLIVVAIALIVRSVRQQKSQSSS